MSIAGKWNVTMPTPLGTLKFTWDLVQDAGSWRGRMLGQAPVGDSELRAIQVAGDVVSFETTAKSPMGALQLAFTGKAAADALTGVCKTTYGEFGFTATRG